MLHAAVVMTSEARTPTVKKDSLIVAVGVECKRRGYTADVSSFYGNFLYANSEVYVDGKDDDLLSVTGTKAMANPRT